MGGAALAGGLTSFFLAGVAAEVLAVDEAEEEDQEEREEREEEEEEEEPERERDPALELLPEELHKKKTIPM